MFKALIIGALLLPLPQVGGTTPKWLEDPPFAFTADATIRGDGKDILSELTPSRRIVDDRWLNGPLTRLDYVLMRIESQLQRSMSDVLKDQGKRYFAPPDLLSPDLDISFEARFDQDSGRVVLFASIDAGTKPLLPISEYCEAALKTMSIHFPQKNMGYGWENGAIGALQRSGHQPEVASAVEALASNAALWAKVQTAYIENDVTKIYVVQCVSDADGVPTRFYKNSYAALRTRR